MKTIKKEQRTFIERLYCDCGEDIIMGQNVLTSFPAQYIYHCKGCGTKITTSEVYPKVTYEDIEK